MLNERRNRKEVIALDHRVETLRKKDWSGVNAQGDLISHISRRRFTVSGDTTMKSRHVIRSASLTFRGFDLTLEEVDCIVGVAADLSGVRGEPVNQGAATLLKRSFARYAVDFIDGCRLDEMIPKLLDYLGGANHLSEAKEKISPEFFEINLVLPVKGSEEQEGGFLSPSILAVIAQLGVTLSFEFL